MPRLALSLPCGLCLIERSVLDRTAAQETCATSPSMDSTEADLEIQERSRFEKDKQDQPEIQEQNWQNGSLRIRLRSTHRLLSLVELTGLE